jgi:hypothetical protein
MRERTADCRGAMVSDIAMSAEQNSRSADQDFKISSMAD